MKQEKCKHGHVSLNFNCKYCLKIRDKWNEKLKKSGFSDIETLLGDELIVLNQQSSNVYKQTNKVIRDNKILYYEFLSKFIYKENFDGNEVDRFIMTQISLGKKIKDISQQLSRLGKKCHRQTIRFVIRKYENKWGIKKWNPEQMRTKRHIKKI